MDIVERLREGKFAGRYWREKEAAYEIGRLREALADIIKDCESDYPPSHGSIKYFARDAMRKSYDTTS